MSLFNSFPFWQNFVSSALATVMGVIIGIPAALWLTGYQEHSAEKRRKGKILQLLREELLANLTVISGWGKEDWTAKESEIRSLGIVLKAESWHAFSDGGELQWIKDPALLSKLSDAYYHVRLIQQLSARYLDLEYGAVSTRSTFALEHYQRLIDRVVEGGVTSLSVALEAAG